MSITSGFYNSQNGDRKYNAEQMSAIFDGIINDGVFASIGEAFKVTPGTGGSVNVAKGKAWLNHTWVVNDSTSNVPLASAPALLSRYDAIILQVNRNDSVRAASITVIQGTAATTPTKPTLTNTNNIYQRPSAYIHRKAGATEITVSDIEYVVGTTAFPFVTGILDTVSIDTLFAKWDAEFNTWFNGLKDTMSDNDVANVLQSIVQLQQYNPYWYYANLPTRRSTFRGNNLGSTFTSAQLATIKDGTFYGLWLGDYWEISGVKYRIVDFDYWYLMGDTTSTECRKHHVVLMPDNYMYQAAMNDNGITTTGYYLSDMNMDYINNARSMIQSAFGSGNLIMRRDFLSHVASDNGYVSDGGWYDCDVVLPNEIMIYGSFVHTPTNDGSGTQKNYTTAKTQLALFRVAPEYMKSNSSYWLRDVASRNTFATVQITGLAYHSSANAKTIGVRPVFAIGG